MSNELTLAVTPVSGGTACITLTEAKQQARVDLTDTAHDNELTRLTTVVTEYIQRRTGRQLVTANWLGYLDKFPVKNGDIIVPRPPLSVVNSITYTDEDGNLQTLATSVYEADTNSEPGRIVLKPDQSWEAVQVGKHHAVTVDFDAGFGAASAVPEAIRHAALMVLSHWFDNHDAERVGAVSRELEFSVSSLLSTWEVPAVG